MFPLQHQQSLRWLEAVGALRIALRKSPAAWSELTRCKSKVAGADPPLPLKVTLADPKRQASMACSLK